MTSPHPAAGRTIGETARRHALLLLALFCVVSSAGLLVAPMVGRRYSVHARMDVKIQPVDGMPALRTLPEGAVKAISGKAAEEGVDVSLADGATIQMASTASTRDTAIGRMQFLAEQARTFLVHHAEELASARRADLVKEGDRLSAAEESLGKQVERFRLAHRGVLPDDPSSVTAKFEKLSNQLDDKQQRLHVLTDQIARLQAYKQNRGAAGSPLPPAAFSAAAKGAADAAPPRGGKAEADPEVIAISAQLQQVNDMLDDDLNVKHRREQHPDVVDLRAKQAALQKRVDAAKERAAAGQPPPADLHIVNTPSAGSDPTLAASQAVDLQIQSLQSEHETLDVDVRALMAQRDALQGQVDNVMPVRREYETLTGQLAGTQKDRQAVAAGLVQHDRNFPAGESGTAAMLDVSALAVVGDSSMPTFPQVPLVYVGVFLVGAGVAAVAAWLLYRADRALHSAEQAAAIIELPILGTVMELRSPGDAGRQRLWRTVFRPAAAIGLALVTVGSAVLCYRHMADSEFAQAVRDRGIGSILSFGGNSGEGRG